MTDRQLITLAVKKAKQSLCTYKVGAIGLSKKGEVVSSSYNISRFMRRGGGVHAEMALMLKSGPALKMIILCRVGNSGDLLPVSPCSVCARKAEELGVKITTVPEGVL